MRPAPPPPHQTRFYTCAPPPANRYNRRVNASPTKPGATKLSVAEFQRISAERMPFAELLGFEIQSLSAAQAVMRAAHRDDFLRPGGSVAGPIMMGLADAAFYAVILANIGPVELAVTTNLSINFLRKPPPGDILAVARIMKLGKRLAVCEATLRSEAEGYGAERPVAHVTATYSIPPSSPSTSPSPSSPSTSQSPPPSPPPSAR